MSLSGGTSNGDSWRERGDAHLQAGRAQEAIDCYRKALSGSSADAEAHYKMGVAFSDLGELADAADCYRAALSYRPYYPQAHNNLGILLQAGGHLEEAIASYRSAISLAPDLAEGHVNLGNALMEQGKPSQALASYGKAVALRPDYAEAHVNMGNSLKALGRVDEAIHCYRTAISARRGYAEAYNNLGAILGDHGRIEEAIEAYRGAIACQPDFAEAHFNLASFLHAQGRYDEAIASYRDALKFQPGLERAQVNLGNAFQDKGDLAAAAACYRAAREASPASAEVVWAETMSKLPPIFPAGMPPSARRAEFEAALGELEAWHRATPVQNAAQFVGNQLPFLLAYQEEDNKSLLARHGRLCSGLMEQWAARNLPAPRPRAPRRDGKVKVGLVSRYFYDHSVWNAIVKGWLAHLDRGRFELHLFHIGTAQDGQTALAQQRADTFAQGTRSLEQWVDAIRQVGPDVLIYPEIGMDPMTVKLASLRLAKAQVCSWGHPETSGLPTVDWYLSAADFEPEDAASFYTERLVALPRLGCAYAAMDIRASDPDLASLGIDAAAPIFICPGFPYKYTPRHDRLFLDIARNLPGSQFVFFIPRPAVLSELLQARLKTAFLDAGMQPERFLKPIPWQDKAAFHGLMRRATAFLDTVGFSGFNTAMQAVECDLPIVTCEGRFMRGRFASGILRRMGVTEGIAQSDAAYVEAATRLAVDPAHRRRMRERIAESKGPLFGDLASIRALEEFLAAAAKA